MKCIQGIQLISGSNEELLPNFQTDFPYIATCAELYKYLSPEIPWHWHSTAELFYMERGQIEYTTPHGKWRFEAGMGGFLNPKVLHTSREIKSREGGIQLLHLFEPVLISGEARNRMDQKYVRPLIQNSSIEMIPLSPEEPAQAELLKKIRQTFTLSEKDWGYEFKLRQQLTDIWMELLEIAHPLMESEHPEKTSDKEIKEMLVYIHAHFSDSISTEQIAEAAHVSKRGCFRIFQENLHMTPGDYLRSYRLRKAGQMLREGNEPVTEIAYTCGFCSGSYFGKMFREQFGCTPAEYRKKL